MQKINIYSNVNRKTLNLILDHYTRQEDEIHHHLDFFFKSFMISFNDLSSFYYRSRLEVEII